MKDANELFKMWAEILGITDMQFIEINTNDRKGNLNESDGIECPKCKNRGYFKEKYTVAGMEFEKHIECSCMKRRRSQKRLQKFGISEQMKKCTFDNYKVDSEWQKKIKKAVQDFTKDTKPLLYIGGQTGSGKTHLCTAACKAFIEQDRDTLYMQWADESKRLKSLITEADAYSAAMWIYKNVDVLYIDDFLKSCGKQTQGDLNLAFEIINYRYTHEKKVTIISSECTLTDLIALDEAMAGRIAEMGGKQYCISIGKDVSKNYRFKDFMEV